MSVIDLFGPVYRDLPAGLCRSLLRTPAAGGLTLREALIMHAILIAPEPPTATSIVDLVEAPQPSVSRCVARLEAMGLIRRVRGKRNRRHLVATLKGLELMT